MKTIEDIIAAFEALQSFDNSSSKELISNTSVNRKFIEVLHSMVFYLGNDAAAEDLSNLNDKIIENHKKQQALVSMANGVADQLRKLNEGIININSEINTCNEKRRSLIELNTVNDNKLKKISEDSNILEEKSLKFLEYEKQANIRFESDLQGIHERSDMLAARETDCSKKMAAFDAKKKAISKAISDD